MVRKIGVYNVSKAAEELSKETESSKNKSPSEPASFEEAIGAAGFGKYNIILLVFGALPVGWAIMNSLGNISQIVPSIKCDFQMTLNQIGLLNAGPYIGNIISPSIMGYLADTLGRRKVMLWTIFADVIFVIICGLSVNKDMLAVFKFFDGFVTTAPSGIIMSYLAECHSEKYRSRVILSSGILMSTFNIILPAIAMGILPRDTPYLHAWQYLVIACSFPSILAGLAFLYFPESPKFLMTQGKHDEALKIFQRIYSSNTGNPPEMYPIKSLACLSIKKEDNKENLTIFDMLRKQWRQFSPLFHKPYAYKIFLCLIIQIFLMMGVNTLRLWLPEILTLVDNYDSNNSTGVTLCQIIGDSQNRSLMEESLNITRDENYCVGIQSNEVVYVKLMVIGSISVLMYFIVTVATSVIPKKIVLIALLFISGLSGIALIWVTDPIIILLVSALYTTQTGVALITFISIIVDAFPTSFRTLTVLIVMTSGRFGSVLGNLIFPVLLVSGCVPPFLYLGLDILICIIPLILLSKSKAEDV